MVHIGNDWDNILSEEYEKIKDCFLLQGSKFEIYGAFYEFLGLLREGQKPHKGRLGVAMNYIEDHLYEPDLSNESIASALGISEVYLRKQFHACYHITPKQYILDLRIQKAKLLLTDYPVSVTDIAEKIAEEIKEIAKICEEKNLSCVV